MTRSIIFNNEDIVTKSSYKPAVKKDAFIDKLLTLLEYEQDYSYEKLIDLQQAEEILLWVKMTYDI